MDRMVSFSPEDVIFLLNKWDTISHEDVEQQETYFEKIKECLHQTWKEVDDSCIFKFSAIKVSKYNIIGLRRKKLDIINIVYYSISEIQTFYLTIKFEDKSYILVFSMLYTSNFAYYLCLKFDFLYSFIG